MTTAKTREGASWIGRSVSRADGRDKLTGRTKYVDDYTPAGCLHGATVRSARSHARIRRIDARAARKIEGVTAVLTAREIPGTNRMPLIINDYPFLADGVVRFIGEAVALVVAESSDAARRAAALVRVEYDDIAAVFDAREAMKSGAPKVFGDDNVFKKFRVRRGDVERAFAEADVVAVGEFETPYQAQAYIETQGMLAEVESDGTVFVAGSMQCPFYVHDAVAAALGVGQNRVRIVQRPTGGGFGGKEDVPSIVAVHAALAAHATGRPVKFVYTREEDFVSMSKRHPAYARVRYAARRDGAITACEVTYILDAGAYATLSPAVLFRGTVHAAGPYRIPNVAIDSFAVATNKVPPGAFRGFGQPQITFAQESLIDELAARLAIDPFRLRETNALRLGDETATGQVLHESCGFGEVLAIARRESGWAEKKEKRRKENMHHRATENTEEDTEKKNGAESRVARGIGVAVNYYGVGLGAAGKYIDRAGAQMQVEKDGTVLIAVGNTEIGQGARSSLCQIAAEALGAPFEAVHLLDIDTTRVPDSGPTVASRTTLMSGNAILDAARPIRETLVQVAAELLGVSPAAVVVDARGYRARDGAGLSFERVVREAYARRLPVATQGWTVAAPTSFDENGRGDAYVVYAFSANVAEVEVDLETFETRVVEMTSVHDIGRVVNPRDAAGQVEGGVVQGMGYALCEEVVIDGAAVKNGNFTGYILPTMADSPVIRVRFVEAPYSAGPFGAKGLAETPIVGPAPAIANAIRDAVGVIARRLPVTPERLAEMVWEKKRKENMHHRDTEGTEADTEGGL